MTRGRWPPIWKARHFRPLQKSFLTSWFQTKAELLQKHAAHIPSTAETPFPTARHLCAAREPSSLFFFYFVAFAEFRPFSDESSRCLLRFEVDKRPVVCNSMAFFFLGDWRFEVGRNEGHTHLNGTLLGNNGGAFRKVLTVGKSVIRSDHGWADCEKKKKGNVEADGEEKGK